MVWALVNDADFCCRTVFSGVFLTMWKVSPEICIRRVPIFTYDKGYLWIYAKYGSLIQKRREISYVTRLKGNAVYRSGEEFDIPEKGLIRDCLKTKKLFLYYGENKQKDPFKKDSYWDSLITDVLVNRQQNCDLGDGKRGSYLQKTLERCAVVQAALIKLPV